MSYEDWEGAIKLIIYFLITIFLTYHVIDWIWR